MLQMLRIIKLLKIDSAVLEKKMITHDGRRTSQDDGRQPIAIHVGHLAELGDLKIEISIGN